MALSLPTRAALVNQQPADLWAGPCVTSLLTVMTSAWEQLATCRPASGSLLVAGQVSVHDLHVSA